MSPPPWECWALPLGVAIDAALGDPRGWPHPVRSLGWLVQRTETVLRGVLSLPGLRRVVGLEYLAGVVLLAVMTGGAGLTVWCVQRTASRFGGVAVLVCDSLLIYWGLAVRSLGDESLRASEEGDLTRARVELSMIVGRDTAGLDRPEICRACVETVAENCNDAAVAPLFWFAVGGPVALWAYKAINTLDSMVGYRGPRYGRLGWASARLDDLAGLVPARLTWLLIGVASVVTGEDALGALVTGWRDGRKHPSPNAAWGESAMAGALGVRLGGPATYQGVPGMKPTLGPAGTPIGPETVRRAVRVMTAASLTGAALAWACRLWLVRHA
ncbi:MAG: adenosylcobinamide-phosphate synthase CbiB [Planctomycetia bacterium]|nr:adenosylcobinamide-phosphate synthase CbiB [Planctomycetia bacterium]